MLEALMKTDPEIYKAVYQETRRQEEGLELIASENYVSEAVLAALGSSLTNKYAEGYPGKRYYGGCEFVDVCEELAITRVKKLYRAEHANVQPHSGTQANLTAYFSVLTPGEKILSLALDHGGHLSHGHPLNLAGRLFQIAPIKVDPKTETIDYAEAAKIAQKEKPKMIVAGASNYSRTLDWKRFREIADSVGAYLLCDMAHYAGLIAAGIYPNPTPHAHFVTSTTHKTLRGPRGGFILSTSALAANLDKTNFPGNQGGPLMHVIAAKAVCFTEAMGDPFKKYQTQVLHNARLLAKLLEQRGFRIVAGGTDCHLFSADLRGKNVTGKEAESLLHKAGITVNKNTIPYDPQKPVIASGIRIGTPAVTTRGMGPKEMEAIAAWIDEAVMAKDNDSKLKSIKDEVAKLCQDFPVYQQRIKNMEELLPAEVKL
ncbi:MAG: serine hydroxymethyltransferase [Elusimicrobia bacterium]|nr:serine hydroxymethyltransferase [Elusimicrobiota bacterium]